MQMNTDQQIAQFEFALRVMFFLFLRDEGHFQIDLIERQFTVVLVIRIVEPTFILQIDRACRQSRNEGHLPIPSLSDAST